MAVDQGPGIIERHLARNPAEIGEGALHAVEPGRLPLAPERLDAAAPRIGKGRHEQADAPALAVDRHAQLAEIDLQPPARRRLETNRRPGLRPQRPAQRRRRALHRAPADDQPVLARQILANHVGIAPALPKPLRQPVREPLKPPGRAGVR
jgi:hypothetical protein